MSFVFVFIIYQIFIVRKALKTRKKRPIEIKYLESVYKIDIKKVGYKRLLLVISLVSSFDISMVVTIMSFFNNTIIKILIAFIAVFIIIYISYYLVGLYYKKKYR